MFAFREHPRSYPHQRSDGHAQLITRVLIIHPRICVFYDEGNYSVGENGSKHIKWSLYPRVGNLRLFGQLF